MAEHSNSADSARRPDPEFLSSRSLIARCLLKLRWAASRPNASRAVRQVVAV
jgi:hypothetical protein